MKSLLLLLSLTALSTAVPLFQVPFLQPTPRWDQDETGTDLDSMVSALSWAYHLSHQPKPEKAIALLQTENDALDLRPENKLALHYARMASRHRDLLTIDELPIKPFDLYHRIKGLALVDHNSPRAYWGNATILSIIDHHDDLKLAPDASPRVIETSASCSSLVTRTIFEETAKSEELGVLTKGHKAMPVELAELLLRTIAIDSGGLKKRGAKRDVDEDMAEKLLKLSSWKGRKLRNVMKLIGKDLLEAKRSLDTLDLRDLLRRDWKGDAVPTRSDKYPTISIGFASIPVSMNEQVLRTPEQSPPEWFAVERAYTSEVGVDVSVVLSNYRNRDGKKVHEIALVVAHGLGKRLHEKSADRLFKQLKEGIESAKELEGLEEWKRPDGKKLLPRRAVWRHYSDEAGRKLIRPIMERSVRKWKG
ncbi:hypothetical protein MNV49_003577 [Pseudohyphozyma bogoriensis]|nr:hypothetical protein MNV49_003577 [Pseudohyphozyma bogoriensis]